MQRGNAILGITRNFKLKFVKKKWGGVPTKLRNIKPLLIKMIPQCMIQHSILYCNYSHVFLNCIYIFVLFLVCLSKLGTGVGYLILAPRGVATR